MQSTRAKGIQYVREVRKILEVKGHTVEGPGYTAYFDSISKTIRTTHKDYFGVYDLISWDGSGLWGHQVTVLAHKAEKIKALVQAKMPGIVWCRLKGPHYQKFLVYLMGQVEEMK